MNIFFLSHLGWRMADGNQTIRWRKRCLPRKFHSQTFWITFIILLLFRLMQIISVALTMHIAATTVVTASIWPNCLQCPMIFVGQLQNHCRHLQRKILLVKIWPITAPCLLLKLKHYSERHHFINTHIYMCLYEHT